jgi:regulator of sirC expression with transglutaminase-like and TPR domain
MDATFEELAARAVIDVALGAALIARDTYPSLDVRKLLARFDALAAPLATVGIDRMNADDAAKALARHVYESLGFSGNESDYYDPRNSLLPDVLDRKIGIPISLALVYCEIGRRVGVRCEGVGFPGHFLVRVFGAPNTTPDEVLVDPFYAGRVLDGPALGALLERVAEQASHPATTREEALEQIAQMTRGVSSRAFLTRWMMNLRSIYLSRGDLSRAMLAVDRLVSLNPKDRALLRDRGLLAARLGANEAARADLERAIAMDPASETATELREALAKLDAKPRAAN